MEKVNTQRGYPVCKIAYKYSVGKTFICCTENCDLCKMDAKFRGIHKSAILRDFFEKNPLQTENNLL